MKKTLPHISRFWIVNCLWLTLLVSCRSSNSQELDLNNGAGDSTQLEESKEEKISQELLDLEYEYTEMLQPILALKKTHSKTYWFIVSWLNTSYRTPDWSGYYSDDWMIRSKKNGIDCSGFTRVMLDQIYNRQVSGGSQGILDYYCKPIRATSLDMGDLVFFRAPYSKSDRIVHVGVYLQENYFVHATSTKSAAKGLGLSVNSLEEENWEKEFVTGGKLKD